MRKAIILLILLNIYGCSFIEVTRENTAFRAMKDIPQRPELPFKNKEQLSRAAALNLDKAEQIYYKGSKPESEPAKVLLQLAKKFISTLGINTDFDPTDPESIKKVLFGTDEANEELRKQNAVLLERIKEINNEKTKIIKDKAKEIQMKAKENSTLKTKLGSLWGWIMFIFWVIIIILVALAIFMPTLGIPIITKIWKMGIGLLASAGKNTMKAINEIRNSWKQEIQKAKINGDETKRNMFEEKLKELDRVLKSKQTPEEKAFIKKLKEEGSL